MRYLILLLAFWCTAASAQVTIDNFVSGAGSTSPGTFATQVAKFDVNDNQVDAHNVGFWSCGSGLICIIGEAYGCGYIYTNSPSAPPFWCGFKVYQTASLKSREWTPLGLAWPTTPGGSDIWQTTDCHVGCWQPRVIYNALNNTWNVFFAPGDGTHNQAVVVCTAATLVGSCGSIAFPTNLGATAGCVTFLDTDGSGYCIGQAGGAQVVNKLNAAFTDGIGSNNVVSACSNTTETENLFLLSGTYYVVCQDHCAYCNGGVTTHWGSNPTGPLAAFPTQNTLSTSTCGGQLAGANSIPTSSGSVVIMQIDQWRNAANEANANMYLEQITATSGALNTLTCANQQTIAGLTSNPPPIPANVATSVPGRFSNLEVINATTQHMQTFTVSAAVPAAARVMIAQNNLTCPGTGVGTGTCGNVTGNDFHLTLVTISSGCTIASTLGTAVQTGSTVTWQPNFNTLSFPGITLSPGTTYGLIASGTQAAGGANFVYGANADGSAYPSGTECISTNGGSSWTAEANAAMRFLIPAAAPSPGLGGRGITRRVDSYLPSIH